MRIFLAVLGFLACLLSVIAFATIANKGTDIQLIAAGVFGTMAAVCFGFSATLARLETPSKETAADLVRELLGKWRTMEESTRDSLARSLITKIDATVSAKDLSALDSMELRSRLSSLLSTKA